MSSQQAQLSQPQQQSQGQAAIWAARNVEWPLPTTLSLSQYKKLVVGLEEGATSSSSSDSYFRGGWMRGVLPMTPNSATSSMNNNNNNTSINTTEPSSRPLKIPTAVATANGWIVAALESPDGSLRLISRWNVRRSSNTSAADHLFCLPPPKGGGSDCALAHIFCDPTGCHTVVSAKNGELYYLHSNSKSVVALPGCGGGTTTSTSGVAASAVGNSKDIIQQGLSPNSYVTSIAWDRERGTEGSTKCILLGTNVGEVYEYFLSEELCTGSSDDTSTMPTLLHTVVPSPISGLHFERSGPPTVGGLAILVVTTGHHTTRLYSFFSSGNMENVAPSGVGSSFFRTAFGTPQLMELPGAVGELNVRLDSTFGLLTSTGMYYGSLQQGDMITQAGFLPYSIGDSDNKSGGNIKKGDSNPPLSMALTPHHVIFLYPQQVVFINRISQKIIQKERFGGVGSKSTIDPNLNSADGQLLVDIRRPDQVWLRKGRTLVHISSSMEDRDVWKYTLQMCIDGKENPASSGSNSNRESMFEQAKSLCSNSMQKAVVTKVRAEYHLQQSRPVLAAKYLAACPPQLAPFVDTALRLAMVDNNATTPPAAALIAFLSDKLRASGKDDPVLVTMLGAWMTELYLYEREQTCNNKKQTGVNEKKSEILHQSYNSNQLQAFLSTYLSQLDAPTILRILSSHDVSASECAPYANAFDLGTAVQTAQSPHDALRVLQDAPLQLSEPHYYRHACALLSQAPVAASKSFLSRYSQGLSPEKLLPSLMEYERRRREHKLELEMQAMKLDNTTNNSTSDENDQNDWDRLRVSNTRDSCVEVLIEDTGTSSTRKFSFVDDETACVKYLEGVIKLGCRSSAVFSYLISLYVKMDDEEPLLKFLRNHVPAAATAAQATKKAFYDSASQEEKAKKLLSDDDAILASPPLDMSYALRTILSTGRHFRSAIHLYMGFGLRQQAVELALKVDPSLARELAQGEEVSKDERKRLWLMIARNAALDRGGRNRPQKDVVAKVVSVLKDCGPDVLSIEDVLPFLPDFCQIDEIKDEICDALTSYSSKIESYLKEMNDCDKTCDELRDEIRRLSNHQMQIRSNARCAYTGTPVLASDEPFYVFPSGYCVLESALIPEVMPFLNEKQKTRVQELRQNLVEPPDEEDETTKKLVDQWQAELDGLIAADCPLTGSIMVESIDLGFPEAFEADEQMLSSILLSSSKEEASLKLETSSQTSQGIQGSFVSIQPSTS
eukprot:CAMPEP_0178903432 /NCGR_PEP_ID=MMETSP0786-20121207/5151_1 /TAXON_ID=186022 /ORGANISM="Thalassionema frauenfeldii, Strain CCMP 1798" /LENGTH=1234 /DNA_ID=CAMNT_0020574797 /DNA_START=203 /DNA_END=3907 /DNA_ORIENTATION=-